MNIIKICLKYNKPIPTDGYWKGDEVYVGLDGSYYSAIPFRANAGHACNFGTVDGALDYIIMSGIEDVTVVQLDLTVVETIIPCI